MVWNVNQNKGMGKHVGIVFPFLFTYQLIFITFINKMFFGMIKRQTFPRTTQIIEGEQKK